MKSKDQNSLLLLLRSLGINVLRSLLLDPYRTPADRGVLLVWYVCLHAYTPSYFSFRNHKVLFPFLTQPAVISVFYSKMETQQTHTGLLGWQGSAEIFLRACRLAHFLLYEPLCDSHAGWQGGSMKTPICPWKVQSRS